MRVQIKKLVELGPLPNSDAVPEQINTYENLLKSITSPVTNEEAQELVKLFGKDDCYGLAWTLLHLIETAPNWSVESCPSDGNEWIELLRMRLKEG